MGLEYNGKEYQFNEVNWAEIPQEQFDALVAQLSGIMQIQARDKRNKFKGGNRMGAVTPASRKVGPPRNVPIKNAYPLPVEEFGWRYWFNYFYNEVPRGKQAHFFEQISPSDGKFVSFGKPDGKGGEDLSDKEDGNVAARKKLLADMMKEGFVAFDASKDRISSADMYETINTQRNDPMRVMFRGDGRTPETIEKNAGTIRQSELKLPYTNMHLGWHPWSDANLAGQPSKLWYRKGFNGDNCLFSVISVTPEFYIATKFPLLQELTAKGPLPTVEVTAKPVGQIGVNATVKERANFFLTTRKLMYSRTNVYVLRVKGGFNTMAMQLKEGNTSFNERAYEKLKYKHHLAVLQVVRVHYGQDANQGHIILVEKTRVLQEDIYLDHVLGPGGATKLKRWLSDTAARGAQAALGIHYHPNGDPAPFKVEKIGHIPKA